MTGNYSRSETEQLSRHVEHLLKVSDSTLFMVQAIHQALLIRASSGSGF